MPDYDIDVHVDRDWNPDDDYLANRVSRLTFELASVQRRDREGIGRSDGRDGLMGADDRDPTDDAQTTDGAQTGLVRRGYDALSYAYRADDAAEGKYAPWLDQLRDRLAPGSAVLDLGCGCGVPVARALAAAGHRVTGLDISDVQIERARGLVPAATFIRADAATAKFAAASFDAVVCLYALIHLPLATQPTLLGRVASWLRPGGWLLAVAGQGAWTGSSDNWLGGHTPMWWSHADAATYRRWLQDAGLEITQQEFVPENDGGHALFWARRPAG